MAQRYGEWQDYITRDGIKKLYWCKTCRKANGIMYARYVTDGYGETHKEYRVICPKCHQQGPVHWSHNLSEHGWNSENRKD